MRTRIVTSAAAVGLALTAFSAPAHAATTTTGTQNPGAWVPITEGNREYPAGTVCSFALSNEVVSQAEEQRVALTYPDGTPLETDYRGPLVVRYTNESTGASVVRDLSGTAQLYSTPDQGSLWVSQDHFGLTVHPGDPNHAAGLFVLTGPSVFVVPSDGDTTVLAQTRVENICDTLG
jgi:hypothetical protein